MYLQNVLPNLQKPSLPPSRASSPDTLEGQRSHLNASERVAARRPSQNVPPLGPPRPPYPSAGAPSPTDKPVSTGRQQPSVSGAIPDSRHTPLLPLHLRRPQTGGMSMAR